MPMNDDPFAPVSGAGARGTANRKRNWISVAPVPADAPPPPAEHSKLGKPSARWTYTDASRRRAGLRAAVRQRRRQSNFGR